MVYLFVIVYICLSLSLHQKQINRSKIGIVFFTPAIIVWTIVVGGQYYVGTDYPVYLNYFERPSPAYEPIFCYLTIYLYEHGIKGQYIFFVFAFINAFFIFIACRKIRLSNYALFFFLLVSVSTFFNSQMNGIRQCSAVSIIFLAIAVMKDSKKFSAILIILATGIHYSALACLPLLMYERYLYKITAAPKILITITCFMPFVAVDENFTNQLLSCLPSEIVSGTRLALYQDTDAGEVRLGFIYRVSKLYFVPLYWWSTILLKNNVLNEKEMYLYKLGLFSYFVKSVLLVNLFFNRFSYYFWIPAIFPVYFLARYIQKRNQSLYALIILYCSFIYFYKVISETQGYTYDFFVNH